MRGTHIYDENSFIPDKTPHTFSAFDLDFLSVCLDLLSIKNILRENDDL